MDLPGFVERSYAVYLTKVTRGYYRHRNQYGDLPGKFHCHQDRNTSLRCSELSLGLLLPWDLPLCPDTPFQQLAPLFTQQLQPVTEGSPWTQSSPSLHTQTTSVTPAQPSDGSHRGSLTYIPARTPRRRPQPPPLPHYLLNLGSSHHTKTQVRG